MARWIEALTAKVLALRQRELGCPPVFREQRHVLLAACTRQIGAARWNSTWIRRSIIDIPAFNVWMFTLGAFAMADLHLFGGALI